MLLLISSCSESELSHGNIESLSLIHAEINVGQSLRNQEENQVEVHLTDAKGKVIRNDSLKVFVNGTALPLVTRQGLYYTTSTYYAKGNVAPREHKFTFELALPDGKKFFLGETRALTLVDSRNIDCPDKGDLNKDFEIKWSKLEGISYMLVGKSVKMKKKQEPNITTYEERHVDTVKIGPSGNYRIPKSTFENTEEQLSAVSFEFVSEYEGSLNPQLGEGSSIWTQGTTEKRAFFE